MEKNKADQEIEQIHKQEVMKDKGCKYYPKCEECPYDHCIYEIALKYEKGLSKYFRKFIEELAELD